MNLTVVLVSSDYLPNIGGVATHVHELARAINALGTPASVVTFRRASLRESFMGGIRHRQLDGVPVIDVALGALSGGRLKYWRLRQDARAVSERFKSASPVVVHVHDTDYGEYLGRELPSNLRVFTNHTSGFLQDQVDNLLRDSWHTRLGSYDQILAPSSELRERTLDFGLPHERVTFVSNGVDPERFRPDSEARARVRRRLGIVDDQVVIISTRRFVPKNGVIDLAHALRILKPLISRVTVLFAGNGYEQSDPLGYEKETVAAIKGSGLADKVIMLGPVPNAEIPELYAAADISVLPSLKEATSISGLEAMSSGLALVGTRIGGIPELITDGRTGLLVDQGDSRALGESLAALVYDDGRRRMLGAQARAMVLERLSWREIARQTLAVYEAALARKKPKT